MIAWDKYENYLSSDVHGYASDKKFIVNLITKLLLNQKTLRLTLRTEHLLE